MQGKIYLTTLVDVGTVKLLRLRYQFSIVNAISNLQEPGYRGPCHHHVRKQRFEPWMTSWCFRVVQTGHTQIADFLYGRPLG